MKLLKDKYLAYISAKAKAEEKRVAVLKDTTEQKAASLNIAMGQTYCAIEKGNCRTNCIHFKKAVVIPDTDRDGYDTFLLFNPRCKLWK